MGENQSGCKMEGGDGESRERSAKVDEGMDLPSSMRSSDGKIVPPTAAYPVLDLENLPPTVLLSCLTSEKPLQRVHLLLCDFILEYPLYPPPLSPTDLPHGLRHADTECPDA